MTKHLQRIYSGCARLYPSYLDCECGYGIVKSIPKTDPVIEAVRKDLHDRSQVGIKKYGTTLADNKGDLRYWLNHAYEECLDQANYLKRCIMEIDANGN